MAVTVQTVQNGARNIIVVLQIAADNTDAVVVDYSALVPVAAGQLKLIEAQWSLTGAGATLEWDATADTLLLEMAVGNGFIVLPEGIPNGAGTGITGDVLLTNVAGLTSGTAVLKFNKQ